MRTAFLASLLTLSLCAALRAWGLQEPAQIAPQASSQAPPQEISQVEPAPIQQEFRVRYVNGSTAYVDGGRNAGLSEGTKLVLKLNPADSASAQQKTLEPGIVARLTVISVASVSAVCQIDASARELAIGDTVSLPQNEVEKLVEKDTLGNTRKYPMVISFTEGDPLDTEVRDAVPRPPLPEVNQIRGRIGMDYSTIRQLGQGGMTSNAYGFVFRADFTRIAGTHWNLNGYWRGILQTSNAPAQTTLQDLINRTYVMSLSYVNPQSAWMASIGRMYIPYASSLNVVDGAFVGRQVAPRTTLGAFAGSTPDPAAWNYNPQQRIGGMMMNVHGGSYEAFHYSSTFGGGVNMLHWNITNPFVFTENEFSYSHKIAVFHSMQIDKPTANPSSPPVNVGVGQSLLTARFQVHPRVELDFTDTYFRNVPTYDPTLVGTGLLDAYLYQGVNGGARIDFPYHVTGYFSIGQSNASTDTKDSMNKLYGVTFNRIWKTGIIADVRYSQFDSSFAYGTYRSITLSHELGERFRIDAQGGRYSYNSPVAAQNDSNFVNIVFDTDLGSRMFMETMFTTQRGGSVNYDQWINTVGFRFDNRARRRSAIHVQPPLP